MSEVKTATFEDLLRERMGDVGIDVVESIRRLGDDGPTLRPLLALSTPGDGVRWRPRLRWATLRQVLGRMGR